MPIGLTELLLYMVVAIFVVTPLLVAMAVWLLSPVVLKLSRKES